MRRIFLISILVIILALFLQGCSSRKTQPKVPTVVVHGGASGTNGDLDGVDSEKANQKVQGYFEKDGCEFVQKGSHLLEILIDTGMELTEIIESIPKEAHDLPLSQRKFPVEFYIDSNMPEEFIEPIYEVIAEWNTETGFEVFTIKGLYDNPNLITSRGQINETDQKMSFIG